MAPKKNPVKKVQPTKDDVDDKLYNRYFQWQADFQKKYGPKTVVLCEVGAFFEIYGVDNTHEKVGVAEDVAKLLNIQCTLKNKKKGPNNSRKNPKMAGFQPPYLQRHLEILLANNWTVVIVEQTTPPPNPKRDITHIYSAGTYMNYDAKPDNNYIASIFIESSKCFQSQMDIFIVGFSVADVSTGENTVHYFYAPKKDVTTVESELFSFVEMYNPREIILNFSENVPTEMQEKFVESINFTNRIKYLNTIVTDSGDKEIFKINYQNQFLKKIFPDTNYLEPIEYLDLEKYPATIASYIILLKFIHEHSPTIIEKINKPLFQIQNQNLVLNNNTIYQLDILPGNQLETHETFKSLYHVIDFTKTPMGKRLLKYHLLNPIYNAIELEHRYSQLEPFKDMKQIKEYQKCLEDIMDLERRHRKLFLKLLQPYEYAELEMSYQAICQLFQLMAPNLENYQEDPQTMVTGFLVYFEEYKKIFNLNEMLKYSLKNLDGSFFNKGQYPEVDVIQAQIDVIESELNKMATEWSNLIELGSDFVTLDKNEKEGYFFKVTTASRMNTLKQKLTVKKLFDTLTTKKTGDSTITKIFLPTTDNRFEKLAELKEAIRAPATAAYHNSVDKLYAKYHNTLQTVTAFIAQVDVVVSHATAALTYGYTKPTIIGGDVGLINVKDLRHPIAERIQTKTNYVPNDVQLGCGEMEGFLLFGINSAGKSCLLKSVGLAVIMAQIGMYVPASKMEYYPFKNIFTRISGNDNMFKGKSSYTIEMQDMNNILKYATENSLVLGDEICKGTEHIAALSIVASSVQWFSQHKIKFVLATHLHQLSEMKAVTDLKNIALKHLEIIYDANEGIFIYNRKLKDGSGESRYGLNVAKYIIDQPDFISMTTKIENELLETKPILSPVKSNYNKNIYLDGCQICGSHEKVEEHHIIYQSEFNENGVKDHIKKDAANNLVFLCEKHHDALHANKLEIKGYVMTSKGPVLRYKILDEQEILDKKKENLKFTDEQIKIMKALDPKLSLRLKVFKLASDHKIRVSTTTLRKILLDIYY